MYYEMIGFVPHQGGPTLSDVPAFFPMESALFLDFDGALVEIAETPNAIRVPEKLETLLNALVEATDGATALVSGREVATLKSFVPGFRGVFIGGHGAELEQNGTYRRLVEADPEAVEHLVELVEAFADCDPAYIAEAKSSGVVLHFRRNPDLRSSAYHFLESILHEIRGFHIHHSKMSFEIRPDGASKDVAVKRLMAEAPFKGRRPIYIGDDFTDEPALAHCRDCEGMAIKVGDGHTEANYRLDGVSDVLAYLAWSLSEPETA